MSATLIQIEESQLHQLLEKAAEVGAQKAAEIASRIGGKEWLNEEEAMSLLNCKRSFLFELRDKNLISISRIASRICLYNRKSIISHIEDNIKK